jgi:hypothetical protein
MKVLRGLEAVSGLLAVVAGAGALVEVALFPPGFGVTRCGSGGPAQSGGCTTTTFPLVPVSGGGALVLFGSVAILVLGVGAAAVWHSRTRERGARTVLWGMTTLYAFVALPLSLFASPLLLASVGFAAVACACAVGRQESSPPAPLASSGGPRPAGRGEPR